MAHLSPYEINNYISELLDTLEVSFSVDTEKVILSKLNRIDSYPDMSKYQLSLAKKRLADCYKKNGITGNALELYQAALSDNKNLPVKRIVKTLLAIPQNELVYSTDINYISEEDMIQHKSNGIGREYDPEYEQQLHNAMGKLGEDYQHEYDRLRNIHNFYSSLPEDAPTPTSPTVQRASSMHTSTTGMTEEELAAMRRKYMDDVNKEYEERWDEFTAKSMAKSKAAQNKHEAALEPARNIIINHVTNLPADTSAMEFTEPELLFVKYLHHKPVSLDYIPEYFTFEHHIDYCKVIISAFDSGLLCYAPVSFALSKLSVPNLKDLLNKNGIKGSGKKADLINTVLSSVNTNCFEKKYYELTPKGIEFTGYEDIYHHKGEK